LGLGQDKTLLFSVVSGWKCFEIGDESASLEKLDAQLDAEMFSDLV
jgi:hypothetical protein